MRSRLYNLYFQCLFLAIFAGALLWSAPAPARPPDATWRKGDEANRTSPIDHFRQLLALNAEQRAQALSKEPADHRKALEEKLHEYDLLSTADREERLQLTQIRWHLTRLMRVAPGERADRLARVNEADRPLIEERLRQWDKVPAELQQEFLENERLIDYLVKQKNSTPAQREEMKKRTPEKFREQIEADLARWHALPRDQRHRMFERFHQFFELTGEEKKKTLNRLPESERQKMEQAVKSFEQLTPPERQQCIDSFRKFSNFTPEERTDFLKNAEQWGKMSPEQRQKWRELVQRMPPMPPTPQSLMPPLPQAFAPPKVAEPK